MWQGDAMSDQPSQDPYGQQPPGQPSQPPSSSAYQQQAPAGGYTQQQQSYSGVYPSPTRKPIDLAKLVGIAAWVVVGLFGLWYLYFISNDDNGGEFVDRFFGGMDRLGEGLFYAGALFALSIWLRRNQGE
jgi:hypothetical protein